MENVRLRRLKADYDALRRLAHLHPRIEIEGVFGNPPERYRLRLKIKSLREHGEVIEHRDRLPVDLSCGDCAFQCPTCATVLCLTCGDRACPVCPAVAAPA